MKIRHETRGEAMKLQGWASLTFSLTLFLELSITDNTSSHWIKPVFQGSMPLSPSLGIFPLNPTSVNYFQGKGDFLYSHNMTYCLTFEHLSSSVIHTFKPRSLRGCGFLGSLQSKGTTLTLSEVSVAISKFLCIRNDPSTLAIILHRFDNAGSIGSK